VTQRTILRKKKSRKMKITRSPIRLFIVGAGNRGKVYSRYPLEKPDLCSLVGIAEPRKRVVETFKQEFSSTIRDDLIFGDWKELQKLSAEELQERFLSHVDAVVICLQDRLHYEACLWFADLKCHILLEKPMALTVQECHGIYEAVERNGILFAVGHVLRYSEVTQQVKKLILEGGIGQIMHIQHLEPVGHFHFAHSYVRGNWKNTETSCFSLMAKSCHDIDWLCYVMSEPRKTVSPDKISSFGSLLHFKKENKPEDATERCLDCPAHVERNCAYSAKKIYLERVERGVITWPVHIIVSSGEIPDIENVTDALRNSDYGKCVYGDCDNDVVDNQVVNIMFDNGATCAFSMVAFTQEICERQTRIHGTKGQIEVKGNLLVHTNFVSGEVKEYNFDDMDREEAPKTTMKNHGYADYFLMKQFIESVNAGDPSKLLSDAKETLQSHLAVFAAEDSRTTQTTIDFKQWLAKNNCFP